MLKIIANSFTFSGIFDLKDTKISKIIGYFLLLVLIVSFPMNYQIVRNDGYSKLNTITLSIRQTNNSWLPNELPAGGVISKKGLELSEEKTNAYITIANDKSEYLVIINPGIDELSYNKTIYSRDKIIKYDENGVPTLSDYQKAIILCKNDILFYFEGEAVVGSYKNISNAIYFDELKTLPTGQADEIFLDMIDSCFNQYMVFSGIVFNTIIQLVMNVLLVLVVASIFLLIRVKYEKITNFKQNIAILVASMTIPTLISFVVGIFDVIELNSFTVVIFQFLSPLLALGAIYKGSKKKEMSIKGL